MTVLTRPCPKPTPRPKRGKRPIPKVNAARAKKREARDFGPKAAWLRRLYCCCTGRRTGDWVEDAGVMLVNQAAYMGHGPRSMTALYKLGELPGQLMGDAGKLKAYASEPDLIPVLTVAVSA